MKYSIVGTDHRGPKAIAIVAALKPGVEVTLVRQPDNKYDRNAVAVWCDGVHVGYVPKNQNAPLARLIDSSGKNWSPPTGAALLGLDEKSGTATGAANIALALDAKFIRSPNSGYPMVEVETQGEQRQ